jgi:hypothetical protein
MKWNCLMDLLELPQMNLLQVIAQALDLKEEQLK